MPYLNETGVDALWKKVKGIAGNKLTATSADSSYTVGLQDKDGNSLSTATIAAASTTAAGVMTKADKSKLNGIATGATKVTVDSSPSDTSGNPLSNKAIQAEFTSMQTQVDDLSISVSAKQDKLTAGDNITISDKNVISATDTKYTLPTATATTLGGIKVGNNLSISDGVLSADAQSYTLPVATSETLGGIKVGDNLSISNGVLSVSDVVAAVEAETSRMTLDSSFPSDSYPCLMVGSINSGGVFQDFFELHFNSDQFEPVFKWTDTTLQVLLTLRQEGYVGRMHAWTADLGDVSQRIATTAFVARAIATAQTGAAMFQGTADKSDTIFNSTYKKGYYWVASAAFTLGTETLEAGDMVFATSDKGSSSSAEDFSVVQANITAISTSYIDALN